MVQFLAMGGPFTGAVLLLGLATLAYNLLRILRPGERGRSGLLLALIGATFLVGVAGTGMGLYQAGLVLPDMQAGLQAAMLGRALGIACITTTLGAALATLNLLVWGLGSRVPARSA